MRIFKTYGKNHSIKIGKDQFISFEDYRNFLIGKKVITIYGKNDIILNVFWGQDGLINYVVKREDNNVIHGTFIKLNEVI